MYTAFSYNDCDFLDISWRQSQKGVLAAISMGKRNFYLISKELINQIFLLSGLKNSDHHLGC